MVVAESRSPRDGRFIETVGYYDPLTKPATVNVKSDRVRYWIQNGARPTDKVRILLRRSGAMTEPAPSAAEAPVAGTGASPQTPPSPMSVEAGEEREAQVAIGGETTAPPAETETTAEA
jgi:small subunit ribosomal protein S16